MTKQTIYKYIGYNGTVTTPILLPLDKLELVRLTADDTKILTDGIQELKSVIVPPEHVKDWKEIKDPGVQLNNIIE